MKFGRIVRVLTDNKRKELMSNIDEKRKIIVSIFYLADEKYVEDKEALYIDLFYPRADEFIKRFAGRRNIYDQQISEDYLRSIKINTYNNVPMSKKGTTHPVIIFSPGLGMDRDSLIYNIEKLVGAGYIVFTIGHIYDSEFTIMPNGVIVNQTKNFDEATLEEKAELVDIRKNDILFLLEELERLNNEDKFIKDMLDLQKIGIMGHSLGGAAVFKAAANEQRIKAVVLLDGALQYINLIKEIEEGKSLDTPLLNFRKGSIGYEEEMKKAIKYFAANYDGEKFKKRITMQNEVLTRVMEGQKQIYEYLIGYRSFIKLKNSEHLTFTDWPVINDQELVNDILPVKEAHEIISQITVKFYNEFLFGIEGDYRNFINSNSCPQICMLNKDGQMSI